jgi:hypothetical protein
VARGETVKRKDSLILRMVIVVLILILIDSELSRAEPPFQWTRTREASGSSPRQVESQVRLSLLRDPFFVPFGPFWSLLVPFGAIWCPLDPTGPVFAPR